MERIRVSADKWHFEEVSTGKRFVPFGSNFCFHYYTDEERENIAWSLGILVEQPFRKDVIERAFATAAKLNMNIMKMFLPVATVLPDPQQGRQAKIADLTPSLYERLEFVFALAEKYRIYISLTLAEWGLNSLKWFNDGGQLFGASSADAEVDSLSIIADFWRQIARWAKGRPQLFSYNLAVESYLPGAACKSENKGNEWYMVSERFGVEAYRAFLRTKYGTVEALNAAHGAAWGSLEEVLPPADIRWNAYHEMYNYSLPIVVDYTEFKEVMCYYYYKNATDAIREVDPEHMVTAGLHPDQIGVGPKGFAYKIANINNKLFDYLDYVTIHLYTQMSYLIDRPILPPGPFGTMEPAWSSPQELERRRRECILYCRFVYKDRPVILEEFGHHRLDEEENPGHESFEGTCALLRALLGHVSGMMLWNYGNFHTDDNRTMTCMMDYDQNITKWGEQWAKLAEPDGEVSALAGERIPARTEIALDYEQAYAPTETTPGEWILDHWEDWLHPVDFRVEENRALVCYKRQNKRTIW